MFCGATWRRGFRNKDSMVKEETVDLDWTPTQTAVAFGDASAHARVLVARYCEVLAQIRRDYPNNKLGGLIEGLGELTGHLAAHAEALTSVSDKVLLACDYGRQLGAAVTPPDDVMKMFEAAQVLRVPVSEGEAAQLAAKDCLVVLRDLAAQDGGLVPHYGAVFDQAVDRVLVRLWWPRVFSAQRPVVLVETETFDVWRELAVLEGSR